jgi:hypothetical protein
VVHLEWNLVGRRGLIGDHDGGDGRGHPAQDQAYRPMASAVHKTRAMKLHRIAPWLIE